MGRPRTIWSNATRAKMMTEMTTCVEAGLCRSVAGLARHHKIPRTTLQDWLVEYPEFDKAVKAAFVGITVDPTSNPVPDFPTFRREYLGHETYAHQQEWIDGVAANDWTLILVPPEHSKTMTMSIEYPTWRIARDHNVRVIVVSKTQVMARKTLMAVKKRLSDHAWFQANHLASVPRDFGPFMPTADEKRRLPWTADMFYVSGIDSAEKDPTMEALGVKGQIYGARADVIVLDDIATLTNQVSETERVRILEWIAQEVNTRLADDGKLIVVGTRVHENDIYATLLSDQVEWAADFHKLVQPAITDEERQEVLWPERWPYDKLVSKRRNRMPLRQWNLVYQQQATGMADAPFRPEVLESCKDEEFHVGSPPPGIPIVLGVDPALTGTLSVCVIALDRSTGERWLVDNIAVVGPRHPEVVKTTIVDAAYRYRASRCRIERNAMQGFLSKDVDLRRRLLAAGCTLEEEFTSASNKFDPEWGIASVASQMEQGLWHIPAGPGSDMRMRPLLEELAAWRPGVRIKQDRVISLWLAELSARGFATYRPGLPTMKEVPKWVRQREVPRWVRDRIA